MNKNKKMKKTIKYALIILIIIAIIVVIALYKSNKKTEVTLNNLPENQYTEEEAKEFYTKKLINYLDIFQNDFHLKYVVENTAEDGTVTTNNEEFSKKGDTIAIYSNDENTRLIVEPDRFYHVYEDSATIYEVPITEPISTNMDVLFYSLESINDCFVKTGNEVVKDQTYYFEEYKMEKDTSVLVRYYFDGEDNIKYIKAYKEGSNVQSLFEIQMLENRTYDFMFEMGDKYQYYEGEVE